MSVLDFPIKLDGFERVKRSKNLESTGMGEKKREKKISGLKSATKKFFVRFIFNELNCYSGLKLMEYTHLLYRKTMELNSTHKKDDCIDSNRIRRRE